MRHRWIAIGLATLATLAAPAIAADGANPAINQPYVDPDYQTWVERFERPGREVYDKREQILAATGVRPGMTVADVGAGTGLYTRLFAKAVGPKGQVYAVDISKKFIDNILRTAREQGLNNVKGIVNSQTDVNLPAGAVDLVFLSDTYHHFEQPKPILASIHRALKPGGVLVVIDFRREPGKSSAWVMEHTRLGKEQAAREIEAAGFEVIEDRDFLKDNYFLKFRRKENRR